MSGHTWKDSVEKMEEMGPRWVWGEKTFNLPGVDNELQEARFLRHDPARGLRERHQRGDNRVPRAPSVAKSVPQKSTFYGMGNQYTHPPTPPAPPLHLPPTPHASPLPSTPLPSTPPLPLKKL